MAYLALPGDCAHIESIVDHTNDIAYNNKSLVKLERDHVPTALTNGRVEYYSILGDYPIKAPLSVADTLRFTPSAALGAEIDIRIHGLLDDPEIEGKDSIATSSTTPVDTTETFREGWSIHAIGTDGAVDNGYITITETTSGTVLGHLAVGRKFTSYHVLQFENPPDTSNTLSIVYKRRLVDLVDDDDVLPVPSMADALKDAVVARMRMQDRKYDQAGVHLGASRNELSAIFSERDMSSGQTHQLRPDFTAKARRAGF